MKFGKYLALRQLELPEYSGHFIDYKALKKLIKQLGTPAGNEFALLLPQEIQQHLKENKASFFFRVERELDKVNAFYLEQQANLAVTLNLLVNAKNEQMARLAQAELLNLRNLIAYLNLHQSFEKIHQDLLRLQQFIELNEMGFSKVVKKWDKRSKLHTKELFIQTAVSVQPVFHKNEIDDVLDLVAQLLFDLECVMDGDYRVLENYKGGAAGQGDGDTGAAGRVQDADLDEVYASFVDMAAIKEPDTALLARWREKVARNGPEILLRIFALAVPNLLVPDVFLEAFLNTDPKIELSTGNRLVLHECCLIADTHHHAPINNGVRVADASHLRRFVVEHILKTVDKADLDRLVARQDSSGRTCLHYAAQSNRLDLLELLLPHAAQALDTLDNESMLALLLLIRHNNFDCTTRLIAAGATCFPETSESKLQYLPLNYACRVGHYDTVEFLLQRQPGPDAANQEDVEGLLPLHVAARLGHHRLVELLIKHGAEVNGLDLFNKWPPLFYAAQQGHVEAARLLIRCGARLDVVDGDLYNVLYYCVVEGHLGVLNELLQYRLLRESTEKKEHVKELERGIDKVQGVEAPADTQTDSQKEDSIPHLELPPPILPLRRYGHNFLEEKALIELVFATSSATVKLFSGTELKPGRITITSSISDSVPRNILLPASDVHAATANCIFQTETHLLKEFRIDFEIFPKFGTRLIAKTSALSFALLALLEVTAVVLPLFDPRLRTIGELSFSVQVILPFSGTLLETTKYDTYWKLSTNLGRRPPVKQAGGLSPNNFLSPSSINSNLAITAPLGASDTAPQLTSTSSFVTATSLQGEYLKIKVCLLNDGTPVVCPHWAVAVAENIELLLPNLSLEQLTSVTSSLFDYGKVVADLSRMTLKDLSLIKKLLRIIYFPLDLFLNTLSSEITLSIELLFPSRQELLQVPFPSNIERNLNTFIDATLLQVFAHIRALKAVPGRSRQLLFSLANAVVCKILNWKQPNFPVFLIMNGVVFNPAKGVFEGRSTNGLIELEEPSVRSIKEAVNFAVDNNLIGVVVSIHLLDLVPRLIPLIRTRGLVLVASNDIVDSGERSGGRELEIYSRTDINGLRFDDILSFKEEPEK